MNLPSELYNGRFDEHMLQSLLKRPVRAEISFLHHTVDVNMASRSQIRATKVYSALLERKMASIATLVAQLACYAEF